MFHIMKVKDGQRAKKKKKKKGVLGIWRGDGGAMGNLGR